MTEAAICVENLSYRFPDQSRPALDGVSVSFEEGKTSGVVGPDGAGKTTLLRTLVGLLKPQTGSCTVLGRSVLKEVESLRPHMGYMPQKFGLYHELTVRQNLDLYAALHGVGEKEALFDRLLEFSSLKAFQERLAGNLSGGMKQKLGLICCLIGDPKLLVLDEPDVGVDPQSENEIWQMIVDLNQRGVTVIWSTSNLNRASQFHETLLLHHGRKLFGGPPAKLTDEVRGRVFQVQGLGSDRRRVLMELARADEVTDCTIQGDSLRVVIQPEIPQEKVQALLPKSHSALDPCDPRFEDAFIARLGGVQEHLSLDYQLDPQKEADKASPVEARRLTKRFGSFTAVDDISFKMARGEIFGLLGPNGAGKSTTFKMLCGLEKATEGDPFVEGTPLLKASSQARALIGYMAQGFSLYNNLTVAQNLRFFGGAYGVRDLKSRIDTLVKAFGLEPFWSTYPSALSLGFKQRLALCCALLHQPPILFLDEPTGGVDPLTRREFWLHINSLTRRGTTVLVSTHLMDEAEFCDRIGFIYQGRLKVVGTPMELRAQAKTPDNPSPTLTDAFLHLCGGGE